MPVADRASEPLYQGILNDIRDQIRERRLMPGDRVPSIGQLTERYKVSAITAKRAVAELQALKLVRSVQGKGTFVAGGASRTITPQPRRARLSSVALLTNNLDARKQRTFFSRIWAAIEQEVDRRKLNFRIQVIPDGGVDFHVDLSFRADPAEGLIFLAPMYPYNVLHIIQDRSVPVVMVDSTLSFANCAVTDNLHGMSLLVDHLRSLGHRRLLLVNRDGHSPNATNENERTDAFRFLVEQHRLAGDVACADDFPAILDRVRQADGPTAVLFTQDLPAMQFREHAAAAGLRVPQDLSVTGFDGWINPLHGPVPGLTTLAVNTDGLGIRAVEMLVELSRNENPIPQWSRIRGQLHTADSTAAPRN